MKEVAAGNFSVTMDTALVHPMIKEIYDNFSDYLPKFKRIVPFDYKKMMQTIVQMEEKGLSSEQAQIEAFNLLMSGK